MIQTERVISEAIKDIQEELGEEARVVIGVFDGDGFQYNYTHNIIHAAGVFAAITANFNKKLADL